MRLLYRYIMGSMFLSYFLCISIALAFYIIIDVFGRFYRFTDYIELLHKVGEKAPPLWFLIGQYYYYQSPIILYNLIPIVTLMAAMFTLTSMSRSNELTPLKACGISMYTLFIPLGLMAMIAMGAMIGLQEIVIPKFQEEIEAMSRIERGRKVEIVGILYYDHNDRIFSIGRYYPPKMEMVQVRMFEPHPSLSNMLKPKRIVYAQKGVWKEVQGKTYLVLSQGEENHYDANGVLVQSMPLPSEGRFIDTEMRHTHLTSKEKSMETISTLEVSQILKKRPDFAIAKVTYHFRLSFLLSNWLLLLLGIPWILRNQTKNMFAGIGICLIISGLFYSINLVCVNLGYKEWLNPVFAVWFPMVLFTSLGISFLPLIHT